MVVYLKRRIGLEYRGKKVTIIGLAREGTALARYLSRSGAKVTISDAKPAEKLQEFLAQISDLDVKLSLGGNRVEEIIHSDVIFVSPGVPKNLPFLTASRKSGIPISSETILFFDVSPAHKIGITGSSGKTTTTTLIGEILRKDGKKTYVGGNIGSPLINFADEMDAETWAVLELSSFQLETLRKSPNIAVITNITPNHLDVHPTMEDYIEAKYNILAHQRSEDIAVLNFDDPITRGLAEKCPARVVFFSAKAELADGSFLRDGKIVFRQANREIEVCSIADIKLRGPHNVYNVLAAAATSLLSGVNPASVRAVVLTFTGVAHRLEPIAEIDGVRYFNDSIATSPERTMAALNSFEEPIVVLLGGRDKHLPMEAMAKKILEKCRAAILFGEAVPLLQTAISREMQAQGVPRGDFAIEIADSFSDLPRLARKHARPGDVVLLSPACTSYDSFRDFEERGMEFRRLVMEMAC